MSLEEAHELASESPPTWPGLQPRAATPDARWRVPVEMALFQATATSAALAIRCARLGARFKREADVWFVGERLVAQVDFEQPIGPEKQDGLVIQLQTRPQESFR